jgi:cytochrome c biogenesis protein CcdA
VSGLVQAGTAVAAGAVTGFGPCAAPRYVALAALASGAKGVERWLRIAAFVAGLSTSSLLLALVASLLGAAARYSSIVYAAMACAFAIYGLRTLLAGAARCEHHQRPNVSSGGAFLLGSSFALVLSPCCAPMLAGISMLAASGSPSLRLALIGAFFVGHCVPLAAAAAGTSALQHLDRYLSAETPVAIVGGALMLSMSAYYLLLA